MLHCCKSTAPDDPPAEEGNTKTLGPAKDRPLVSPERPLSSNIIVGVVSDGRNFVTPSTGTKKVYFSTLAPDPSDETVHFFEEEEEEEATGEKRKTDPAVQVAEAEPSRPTKRTVRGG